MIYRAYLAIAMFFLLFLPSPVRASEPSCIDCHPDKSENTSVHPAVAMGCDSCHAGTHSGEMPAPKLIADAPDLCFNCHDAGAFTKTVQHPPIAGGMCLSCHDPHASSVAKLLKQSIPDLCFTCHDQGPFSKSVQHAPAAGGMCTTCHAPHSGEIEKLLVTKLPDLCTTCHDQMTSGRHVMRGFGPNDRHPLQDRPDPSRPGTTISCVSCHHPHASDRARLFQGQQSAQPNVCDHCHRKIAVVP